MRRISIVQMQPKMMDSNSQSPVWKIPIDLQKQFKLPVVKYNRLKISCQKVKQPAQMEDPDEFYPEEYEKVKVWNSFQKQNQPSQDLIQTENVQLIHNNNIQIEYKEQNQGDKGILLNDNHQKLNLIDKANDQSNETDFLREKQFTFMTKKKVQPPQEQTDKYGCVLPINGLTGIHPVVPRGNTIPLQKQINARIQKWRDIIPKMAQMIEKEPKKYLEYLYIMGIPEGIRTLIWPLLAQKDKMLELCGNTYEELNGMQESAHCGQIELDIRRTFPDNVNFHKENICIKSLKNVLNAISISLPDLGYCQGMNFIAASLLLVTSDENTFWIMYSMIVKYNQKEKYIEPGKVLREFYAFDKLMRQFFPQLSTLFIGMGIDTALYAIDWFITLFSSIMPLPILYRFYDIFLLEGEKSLYRCGLAIIHFKQKDIYLCNGFEETLICLKNKDDIQAYDQQEFIRIMTNEFIFSKSQLNDYLKEHDEQQK